MKKRMLITGVSGLLGNNLAHYFRSKYQILGLYNDHAVCIKGISTIKADILSCEQLKKYVHTFRPDIVIHCASLTNIEECQDRQYFTRLVNVIGTRNVLEALDTKTKLIYISTDSVYDGRKGNFKEPDHVFPQNYYGLSKFEGELEVSKRKNHLVLRTNIFGWNIRDKFSIAEWILNELRNEREIKGFKDAYFSSIYTLELAKLIDAAIKKNLTGIYNCASKDSCSKYKFACRLARRFGLNASLIKPIAIDDFGFMAKRGKNLSLNVQAISRALRRTLPTIKDSIEHFYDDHKTGLPGKIKSQNNTNLDSSKIKLIPYGRQSIDEQDISSVINVLSSDWITQGPKIKEFEDALCKYTGAKYAVCVSSGTAALHLACLAGGIKVGDEVITSPITFVASANCVLYCSGKPVFADINPDTANIDPMEIKKKVNPKTKAIIPVHFAGYPCDLERISRIAKKHNVLVIEDAAHALGAEYKGAKIGSCVFSDMAIFSFHPVKSITTGEGGAVLTNRRDIFERLLSLRNHGITKDPHKFKTNIAHSTLHHSWYYEMQELGFNYRITDLQAALGISQLRKIDDFIKKRRQIAHIYNSKLSSLKAIELPVERSYARSSWHIYVIKLTKTNDVEKKRRDLFEYLRQRGVGAQVHYIPVFFHPYYQKRLCLRKGDFPVTEDYYDRTLTIPLYPKMTAQDIELTVNALIEFFK